MANNFVISQKVDLNKGIDGFVVWPHALLIEGDNLAHTWEVDVYQDGKPATLDGMTAKGYFVRSDGSTVDATGSVSGNKVSVTFPSPAYAYEGDLQAIIRLTNTDGSLITLSAMLFRVVSVLTDRIVDPENVIPSLEELLDKIEKLEQATTAANAATSKANTAASEAEKRVDTAVKSANDATSAANAAAGRVDTSITNANKAADRANTAAQIVEDLQVGDLDIGSIATKTYSRRASATYDYGGRNLKDVFGTVEAMRAALVAEDYTNIAVGDYWPITLNGTFRDYGSYTVPVGTDVYSDVNCQMKYGTVGGPHEGSFVSDTAVLTSDSLEATIYAKTSDCLPYFERTCTNVTVKLEVAGINHYWRYGDSGELTGNKPHIVFISRDCLPFSMRMRKGATKWEDESATNPWLGSALFKTLNDETHGVLALVAATDIGAYIYAGPNNNGMRARMETKPQTSTNATGSAQFDRGKLFLPSEYEVAGSAISSNYKLNASLFNQYAIFNGSNRHIVKGNGDSGSRTTWWLATSCEGYQNRFATFAAEGLPSEAGSDGKYSTPICFIFA